MDKYKEGDCFLMKVDHVEYEHKNGKDYSFYVIKPNPPTPSEEDWDLEPPVIKESFQVSEDFLDHCSSFGLIADENLIHVTTMKPCPFCGCKMILRRVRMLDGCTYRYEPKGHHKRGCALEFSGSAWIGWPKTISAAVAKWNRRIGNDD